MSKIIKTIISKINHYLGQKFQPNKVIERGNMFIVDCTFDKHKVMICNCNIKQPCSCRSIISLKRLNKQ